MRLAIFLIALVAGGCLFSCDAFAQADLDAAAAWFKFDGLFDANGPDVSILDGIDGGNGAPTVGNAATIAGPGSNNQFAEFFGSATVAIPDVTGGYFRANPGDGAGTPGELDIDGSYSAYTRVNFDRHKLMYLYNKFEHKSGNQDQRLTFLRLDSDGTIQLAVGDGLEGAEAVHTTTVLDPNTWYDIATSFDDANDTGSIHIINPDTRAIIDSATGPLTLSPQETDDPFLIGARENFGLAFENDFVEGKMEMLAIWPGTVYTQADFIALTGGDGPSQPPPTDYTWTGESGDWKTGDNWNLGSAPGTSGGPFSSYHTTTFSDSISEPATVFTTQHVTVNSVTFNNSTHSYGVAGLGSVSLITNTDTPAANPSINVTGTHQFQTSVGLLNDAVANVADASTLTFNNALSLNGNTLTKTGNGTLLVNNVLSAGGGTVIGLEGTIGGSGTIGGNLNNSTATVAPGNSPGILTVTGNYSQGGSGTLEIEIVGSNPGEGGHDQVLVGGSASLNGTLDILTDAGFTPAVGAMPGMIGDKFVIMTASSVSGEFSTVNGRHAGGGKFYKVGYNPTNVSLGAFQALGGDTEGDFDVDITDFNMLAGNFGNTGVEWTDADFDANNVVDITDFNTLAGNFGPYGGGDGPGQVPEPSAWLLTLLGSLGIAGYHMGRRR